MQAEKEYTGPQFHIVHLIFQRLCADYQFQILKMGPRPIGSNFLSTTKTYADISGGIPIWVVEKFLSVLFSFHFPFLFFLFFFLTLLGPL